MSLNCTVPRELKIITTDQVYPTSCTGLAGFLIRLNKCYVHEATRYNNVNKDSLVLRVCVTRKDKVLGLISNIRLNVVKCTTCSLMTFCGSGLLLKM